MYRTLEDIIESNKNLPVADQANAIRQWLLGEVTNLLISRRVFDCFMFYNELELLEIRLNELDNAVDKFILVESTVTHAGKPKPLYFNENKERFSRFLHKIKHIIVDTIPMDDSESWPPGDTWVRENYQRNILKDYLTEATDDDVIIISDIDEIPRASAVSSYDPRIGMRSLNQRMYFYWLNCLAIDFAWTGPRILGYKEFKERNVTLSKLRYLPCATIDNAGWHFCFQGGVDKIIDKIESWPHSHEYNIPSITNRDWIIKAINTPCDVLTGIDIDVSFGYQHPRLLEFVFVDESFPEHVLNNLDKFKLWIK